VGRRLTRRHTDIGQSINTGIILPAAFIMIWIEVCIFILKGPNWRISASLPHAIQVGLGEHVVLEMEADKPYIHYDEHKHKYPPGQFKNEHKKVKNKKNKKLG